LIIDGDVIKLRGGLVIPGTPGGAFIRTDADALIGGLNYARRVARIDPDEVIVVAARRSFEHRERLAAVSRTVDRRVRNVHGVGIVRIHGQAAEIPGAGINAGVVGNTRPGRTGIVGSKQPATARGIDERVHTSPTGAARYCDSRTLPTAFR